MGVKIGLIIGLYFAFIYFYKRFRKEDLSSTFINCNDLDKVYIYWTRNSSNTKRPIPVYIDGVEVGMSIYKKLLILDKPENAKILTVLSEYNSNVIDISSSKVFKIVVDSAGRCERYKDE